ncbi:sulfatase [Rubinisphaera italica]|uniref:Arylsulfatase n=1 Tax=Rubinisphaera italica TaxID=2527969 RepID=A0A5C5X8P8_9PLAN|nr:sulfatase [Rubinisphaera italica]TWT59507.1 Arylsulfatase precursor [Rubinisphaera italica]
MQSRTFFVVMIAGLVWLTNVTILSATERMNFVFLLVDDLGWADLGCFGSEYYETPHIDQLCESGMKFTQAYAACPVCSPTRASIMTGRHPVRVDITDWIPGMDASRNPHQKFQQVEDRENLALEETTIAEALKEANYQTFFAGKWHLGEQGHWPNDQGFDFNLGGHHRGSPPGGYYAPWNNPVLKSKKPGEYLTERLTEESISFLKKRKTDQPFLLYLSYYNVHTPIQPYKKKIEHFQQKANQQFEEDSPPITERDAKSRARQDNPEYASMIAAVDLSVGSLMKTLAELQLEENTTVIFFSDNGGLCTKPTPGPTSNLPLRSGKGWLYEGGVREPMIIRSPGITKAGSVCVTPIVSMDFFPTILELAGLPSQPHLHADGQSLVPLLNGQGQSEERTFYWHYPHYHGSTWCPGASIREGDWKLIEFYQEGTRELYNLKEDPGEQENLVSENPVKTLELQQKLAQWQKTMKAKMPQPLE